MVHENRILPSENIPRTQDTDPKQYLTIKGTRIQGKITQTHQNYNNHI